MVMDTKRCTKCGVTKSVDQYHKRGNGKFYAHCIECHRKWVSRNSSTESSKKKRRERDKDRYWSDDGKRRDYLKEWWSSDKGKDLEKGRYKDKYAKNPEKFQAKSAVQRAIKKGLLPRASDLPCDECGKPATEFHHESYAVEHRLDVIPLCKMCHRATY